ncbi:tigger transposable element-derived protein 1-like [Palaemon carinicauda]|uniref:tigger transposable element-derived protein 1-like n=1 Tax=Palaemon carinicauda TaxID=392227 RepID=UPI0035B62F19
MQGEYIGISVQNSACDALENGSTYSSEPKKKRKMMTVNEKSWFEKFKRVLGLRIVPLYGKATSADQEAALRYVEDELPKLVKEGGYLQEQLFNKDETGLFWKRMQSRTFLYMDEVKKPWFKANKDPAQLNSQVKLYLAENGLSFKVLLLMDCAGGHTTDLHYDGIQVERLSPNTTSLIQPMNQGVIRTFEAPYTRSTMECLYSSIDKDEVYHSAVDKAERQALLVANEGFSDMTTEDVNLLIECHLDPLTVEDVVEMPRSASEEEEAADVGNDDEAEECGLTLDNCKSSATWHGLRNKGRRKLTIIWSEPSNLVTVLMV